MNSQRLTPENCMTDCFKTKVPPRLLALEGPSGVGKTTLFNLLALNEELNKRQLGLVGEFSETPYGQALDQNCTNSYDKRWDLNLGGLIAYIADKTLEFNRVLSTNPEVIIADRFFSTQRILSLPLIKDLDCRETGITLICELENWARRKFAPNSLIVVLTATSGTLKNRLGRRLGRELTEQELERIYWEKRGVPIPSRKNYQ